MDHSKDGRKSLDGRAGGPSVRLLEQPSLVQLAADALRDVILAGELKPGDRVIEERLTRQLGISRPPLREAMRLLEREGLLRVMPRRGAIVPPLSRQDVWEIETFRAALDRLAVELGVPVSDSRRLETCRDAIRQMEQASRENDWGRLVGAGSGFHLAVAALPGHRRLEESYRNLQHQLRLYMAMNSLTRRRDETIEEHVERHRRLFRLIEAGDPKEVLAELAVHGDRTYLEAIEES